MRGRVLAFWMSNFSRGKACISLAAINGKPISQARSDDFLSLVGTKIWCFAWLIVVALVWGALRSVLLEGGIPQSNPGLTVPVWLRVCFMALFMAPLVFALRSRGRLLWLLGAAVTVGFLPEVPLMPYAREYAHLVFIVIALGTVMSGTSFIGSAKCLLPIRLYGVFLALCTLSIITNYILREDIWQLKVGISSLILYLAFGVVIAALAVQEVAENGTMDTILDGFAWAAIGQIIITLAAIVITLQVTVLPGNDTMFGLGYWDRMKTTFAGPNRAALFFAVSIPLLILWANNQRGQVARFAAFGYLQLAPWFVVATGSRSGRIALIISLGACLLRRSTRQGALAIMPSCFLSFYVGFYYRSLAAAIQELSIALSGGVTHAAGIGFKGSFFHDVERVRLAEQTVHAFRDAPLFTQLFGMGLGVAGCVTCGYPSPHLNILKTVVDVGLVGLLLQGAFFVAVLSRLGWIVLRGAADEADKGFVVLVPLLAVWVVGFAEGVETTGVVMVVCAMAFTLPCRTRTSCIT